MNKYIINNVILSIISLFFFQSCVAQDNKVSIETMNIDTLPSRCEDWKIPNKENIGNIIKRMTKLSGERHECCYNNFSCSVTGFLFFNKKKYRYTLNAGGWCMLVSMDYKVQFYLACTYKEHKKYFISTYDPPK